MIVVFSDSFHDFDMSRFVPQGIACLEVGLLIAIPAALCGWLVLRRGFAVDAVSAGLAAGTLAGLAGVITLELHCPNFRAMHVMVWHTLVIPVSAAGGALLGVPDRAENENARRFRNGARQAKDFRGVEFTACPSCRYFLSSILSILPVDFLAFFFLSFLGHFVGLVHLLVHLVHFVLRGGGADGHQGGGETYCEYFLHSMFSL